MILWNEEDCWWQEDLYAWAANMKQLRSIVKDTGDDVRKHAAYFKKKNEQELIPKADDPRMLLVAHMARHYSEMRDKLTEDHKNIKKEMDKIHNRLPFSHLAQWKKESDEFDAIINIVSNLGTLSWYENDPPGPAPAPAPRTSEFPERGCHHMGLN
jgi:hypothetical protein